MSAPRPRAGRGFADGARAERLVRRYGEREALGGVDLTLEAGRERWSSSAPTAPARRRCCACSRRCCARTRAASRVLGSDAARRGLGGARADRPARARAAALPRADRAREPALPRPPARRRRGAGRRAARRRRDVARAPTSRCARSRAAWCSASRSRARCCTSPSCCCSTSRYANLDPAAVELRRAADRRRPRRARAWSAATTPAAGWPRPTSCSACAAGARCCSPRPARVAPSEIAELYR